MNLRRFLGDYLALIAGAVCLLADGPALAVTQYKPNYIPFSFDIGGFTTTLTLPVKDVVEDVKMPTTTMLERLEKAQRDETVEPLTILVGTTDAQIAAMAEKLAVNDKEDEFANYLRKQMKISKSAKSGSGAPAKTVVIDEQAFTLIDKDTFADMYSKPQHNLTVDTSSLKRDRLMRRELIKEISPFLSKGERDLVQTKVNKGDAIDVNTELLPEFAKKMIKKYVIYRGPNCFHAALAFQSPLLTSSSLINVKREVGYHRAMINYDELWRVLSREFYEVDPRSQPLKYGDMLVLFDVPDGEADHSEDAIDFRWIRHTATYLFGGYTFSKGSKSPNTPYTVRTLSEEWKTWKHFTKNLAIKVYRRSLKTVSPRPPVDLTDWIY